MLQSQANYQNDHFTTYERLDEEGFIIDALEWDKTFTERRASSENIQLTHQHWLLIDLIRDKYMRLGALPPMRSICKSAGVDKKEIKNQFGSCLKLWKMAGLPHPGEEAKTYMN